jgi:CHAD domain-containing protein
LINSENNKLRKNNGRIHYFLKILCEKVSTKELKIRVNDSLVNPTVESIHDVRTSIRRLDASFKLLPKKIRDSYDIRNYHGQYRQLFKINSEIRDIDIIYCRLIKYSSESIPIITEDTFKS